MAHFPSESMEPKIGRAFLSNLAGVGFLNTPETGFRGVIRSIGGQIT
jgi:hypothetical protein